MPQSIRQSELYAGNDWLVIYKAFTKINFNAFDFNSIRQAMTDYIRMNYPESFNDWIDSSEFVALIDLLAYLGESLAFRIDLNARENFIDTARRRESVLRLARFLSYSPKRNSPAQGLVKILQITTNENVYDSSGNNLSNQTILWNDITNPNWFEQWIIVMNSVFISSNPFGTPLKELPVNGVNTQLYRFNNIPNGSGNFPFTTFVDNDSFNFDICNVDFSTSGGFTEVYPNPQGSNQIVYRNDGNGNSSPDTGFFMLFKQGTLQRSDFEISQPLENRVIYINTPNINQSDVWVQTVNDGGYIVTNGLWTRVGYVPTDDLSKILVSVDNVTYNSVSPDIQNIYQVVTQDNDQVMLRFGDGRFGQIPTGNLRVWYRVSANQLLNITPDEMQNIEIQIPYLSSIQTNQTLTINFSLQTTVANGTVSESSADIARRAGLNYSTQARMVSGSDYNSLPSTNNLALKVKSINRVYSGQSRFLDLNDPTGNYQNTNVFSDDGAIYTETQNQYSEIPNSANLSSEELVTNVIMPQLDSASVRNFLYNEWLTNSTPYYNPFTNDVPVMSWFQSPNPSYSSTGYFKLISNGAFTPISNNAQVGTMARYMTAGSLVKFTNAGWVSIVSVDPQGGTGLNIRTLAGPVKLSQNVQTNDQILQILPAFNNELTNNDITNIVQIINNRRTFGISYNFANQSYSFVDIADLNLDGPYDYSSVATPHDSTWIVRCDYSPSSWKVSSRSIQYVFESIRDVKFFFINKYKSIDITTNKAVQDSIKIIKATKSSSDKLFFLDGNYTYSDGYIEPRRVIVSFADDKNNGLPNDPESFSYVMPDVNSLVFHRRLIDQNGYEYYQLIDHNTVNILNSSDTLPTLIPGQVVYQLPANDLATNGQFHVGANAGSPSDYKVNSGVDNLYFQWKHYAPTDHRIDPAISNIIDIYVLQNEYYNSMLTWRTNGCDPMKMPIAPTEDVLGISFGELEQFKMFSDEIVWHPVNLKLLFGSTAISSLQLNFKVVPLLGTLVSDGEIKSRLVAAVYNFFDVSGWDFGETFYYSELAGYLHAQLIDCIASVVPVPLGGNQSFGDLFEIRSNPDELFFPTVQVDNVEIIPANTQTSLRITA